MNRRALCDVPLRSEIPSMSPLFRRRLKYFLRLEYPLWMVFEDGEFVGGYRDLGVSLRDVDITRLHTRLDELRRQNIADRVENGDPVPMPNSGGDDYVQAPHGAHAQAT